VVVHQCYVLLFLQVYRKYVFQTPEFIEYFNLATPAQVRSSQLQLMLKHHVHIWYVLHDAV
jgi:hypothetical protein